MLCKCLGPTLFLASMRQTRRRLHFSHVPSNIVSSAYVEPCVDRLTAGLSTATSVKQCSHSFTALRPPHSLPADTDVLIWEGDPADPTRKPPEMYTLVENFCLGTRRLEIFGKARSSLRRGWVTVLADAQEVSSDSDTILWEKESWETGIREMANGGKFVVPMTAEIDALRPKSPFRSSAAQGTGAGRGTPTTGGVYMGTTNNTNNAAALQNSQMQSNMMAMGMPGMGMPGMPVAAGMEGIWPMGMGVPGMGMNMVNMGMGMGAPMGQQGMGVAPYGHFTPAMGLGGPWLDATGGAVAWDGTGMEGMMGGNMMGLGMGMGNMGMMGQWGAGPGAGGYDGY
jgi:hypothetical protein